MCRVDASRLQPWPCTSQTAPVRDWTRRHPSQPRCNDLSRTDSEPGPSCRGQAKPGPRTRISFKFVSLWHRSIRLSRRAGPRTQNAFALLPGPFVRSSRCTTTCAVAGVLHAPGPQGPSRSEPASQPMTTGTDRCHQRRRHCRHDEDLMPKLRARGLTKVFGPQPRRGLELMSQGLTRSEILERTGQLLAVAEVDLDIQ